jgi:hypothetical protein
MARVLRTSWAKLCGGTDAAEMADVAKSMSRIAAPINHDQAISSMGMTSNTRHFQMNVRYCFLSV